MPLNLGTTGIGSHPIDDLRRIIIDQFESHITIPYVPQLRKEEMIGQFQNEFPGLSTQKTGAILDLTSSEFETKIRAFKDILKMKELLFLPHGIEIQPNYFPTLYHFADLLRSTSQKFQGIKCQITGPITEAASIRLQPGNAKLIRNAELFETVARFIGEVAHWLSSSLLQIAKANKIPKSNVILFLDEPLFPLSVENDISYHNGLEKLGTVFKLIQCKKGIHICDNPITVLDEILKYPIDLFSFDAIHYPDSLKNTKIEIIEKYIEEGGGFAFGITPNTPETLFGVDNITSILNREIDPFIFLPSPDYLIHLLQKNIHPLSKRDIPIQQLLSQSIITPACGFRNFNIPSADDGEVIVKNLLRIQEQAAKRLRKDYGLTEKSRE
ncbi:MAG: hypothetical protein ACTSRS_13420 [Candidatus Helarchaeota archaeon]